MTLDGWSNIHNEPIICISVTDASQGTIHLIETIDTADNSHTGEYLLKVTVDAINTCQKFGCFVRSVVTDNATNMAKMEDNYPNVLKLVCQIS